MGVSIEPKASLNKATVTKSALTQLGFIRRDFVIRKHAIVTVTWGNYSQSIAV